METHIIWKKESIGSPGSFNFHNLCCFVGYWGPIYPLTLMMHGIVWISFDTVPKKKYLMPIHWEHLVLNLLKVVSRCVVDVVRHLSFASPSLVSRWFDLMKGQPGLISEGLHAMLEVAAKMFLKSIFFPSPQVQGCLLQHSLFPILQPLVIPLSWQSVLLSKNKHEAERRKVACSSPFLL